MFDVKYSHDELTDDDTVVFCYKCGELVEVNDLTHNDICECCQKALDEFNSAES